MGIKFLAACAISRPGSVAGLAQAFGKAALFDEDRASASAQVREVERTISLVTTERTELNI